MGLRPEQRELIVAERACFMVSFGVNRIAYRPTSGIRRW